MSAQQLISPNNIHTLSRRLVMRIYSENTVVPCKYCCTLLLLALFFRIFIAFCFHCYLYWGSRE